VLTDPPERRLAAKAVAALDDGGGGGAGGGGGGSNGGSSSSLGAKTRYRSLLLPPPGGGGAFGDGDNDPSTSHPLVTVEELALQHYSKPEQGSWKGVHAEGGIWRAFFVLFLWEALFCSPEQAGAAAAVATADVFRSPFQTAPLDLDTDAFFPARAPLIERRLQELAAGDEDALERTVRMRWAAHAGCACRGMAWAGRWQLDGLVEIARCVGPLRMSVVLRLMAEDHAGSSGGMPDLLLWSTAEEGGASGEQGGRAMMVEVKSRNDRLSDQQRMWISALASGGWDVHVLKVTDDG
jgi:Fanconi-associated nuclease 1